MPTPILTTKLYILPPRPNLIRRPRLIERLNEGLHGKLTLISAPAGFGKTTLVSAWVAALHPKATPSEDVPSYTAQLPARSVAWLSLDEEDNDPIRFLIYLVAALQTLARNGAEGISPVIGEAALGLLQSPQPPPIESILTVLLNEIAAVQDNFLLILDDYHVLDAQPVDKTLTFLIEHMPPQMHLVITTREDPDLPLARYRVRGQLTELRAVDLRFTPAEAAEFLNQGMGLSLSDEEIFALERRTEGWIAGLQMAALSMQGRADSAGFIQAFAGSHRFVLDYLAEEVLQRQPERVRNFLLQTSILSQLGGSLCDAVTGLEDGRAMLEALERGNLFVVPLDDRRQWYRYHHLFTDVLHAHLMDEQPDQIPGLHQRASEWYEQNSLPSDAIRHAFAAENFERAAALVEMAWPAIFKGFHPATWLGWVKALPDALVRARPVLCVGYAWTLLDGGELKAVEARLRDAEQWLDTVEDASVTGMVDGMIVVNEESFRSLPATIASARAYLAQALGDVPSTVEYARQALELLPEEDHYWRGITAMFLGMAYWTSGELEAAYRSIADSVASLHLAGHVHFQIVGAVFLADIRVAQGRLQEAESAYEQALQITWSRTNVAGADIVEPDEPVGQGTVKLYVGLSALHCERDDLEAATQCVLSGKALAEHAVASGNAYRLCAAMAQIKEAQGDLDDALGLLNEAERLYERDAVPDVRPVPALKTRVWIRQGRLAEALGWARDRGLSANDDLSYLREFEHITLARVLIAEYRNAQYRNDQVERVIHAAMGLMERLQQAAKAGGRTGSVIEILVLQALAHWAQGDIRTARLSLEQALALAEPEGYVRIFVNEGEPMRALLSESLAHGAVPAYITQLLAALDRQTSDEAAIPDPNQLLIEPLSKRELEVLRLLAVGHTNQAVADELIIAVSTVKKHVNNIFGKLGVGSRTQVVSRARELGIL